MAIDQAQMQDYAKQWGQLVARAWGDEAFKRRLLAEPAAALAEQGIRLPPGVEIRVHEDSPTAVHLTLPPAPSEELSDEQLDAVAGGDTSTTVGVCAIVCAAPPPPPWAYITTHTAGSAATAG
jgi:hypothetical protein